MSRRYEEQVEVRMGPAAEHGVRVEGALPTLAGVPGPVQGDGGQVSDLHDLVVDQGTNTNMNMDMVSDLSTGMNTDTGTVAVEAGAGVEVPTLFLWRGRVHLVRAVLAQWSQRVPWWRAEDPVDEGLERRVWRVEAGAGRSMGTGVYDLVQDDRWWLTRVSD